MRHGELYKHYKGTEYIFDCVAVPIKEEDKNKFEQIDIVYDANTPEGEELRQLKLYISNGYYFIEGDTSKVLYYSEDDYSRGIVWARDIDDFFTYVEKEGKLLKRFNQIVV